MGGFCGWLGCEGVERPRELLGRMTEVLGPSSTGASPTLIFDESAALASRTAETSSGAERHGPLLIGWEGPLLFRQTPWETLARSEGAGTALARAHREMGPSFLDTLSDAAAVAIIDRERHELLLACDRFGTRTVYACPAGAGVVFATRGRAVGRHPGVAREIDPQSVFDYVYFHMVPGPRAIFRNWERLLPGTYLRWLDGRFERRRYWKPTYWERTSRSEKELIEEYRSVIRRATRACLETAKGKVGAFLSGGTDSSTVSGLLCELTGEPARTYSIGFDVQGYDESRYARIAAGHFGTRHLEHVITPGDVLAIAPRLAEAYEEPFGNASAVASYYCARLAREDGVDTMLGGDGGDELFAGNERYARQNLFERYQTLPPALRARVIEPVLSALPSNGLPLVAKAKSYVRQARIPLPDRLETYNLLSRIPPTAVFTSEFLEAVSPEEPLELLRSTYREARGVSTLNRLLYLDLKLTLADNDLRKVGRTCEMAGVDVGYPFLKPELVDFANRIPPHFKLKGTKLRYFFKRASRGFLPNAILKKTKHGFGVPCGRWMRDDPALRELAHESLRSLRRRGYLSPRFTERLLTLHQGEHGDYYGVMVWVLTMLELWHEKHEVC